MIRTTTTIRGSRVNRGDIPLYLSRVSEIVSIANETAPDLLQVQFTGSFEWGRPAAADKIEAKVVVGE